MLDKVKPSTSPIQLRCNACRAIFDDKLPIMVPMAVATEALMALKCPDCGGKDILWGQQRTTVEDDRCRRAPADAPLETRAEDWRRTGEKGQSADAIFAHMTGGERADGPQHPLGAADLHRCMLLLRRIPEWSGRMAEMSGRSESWAALIASWPRITQIFNEEAGPDLATWPRQRTESLIEFVLQHR